MNVSILSVDSHNFPNLALMKIASWHRSRGDIVDWYPPMNFYRSDRIYASKVFTFTPDFHEYRVCDPEPIRGGTGYDSSVKLPDEIENAAPDYSIYPQFRDTAFGFLTRGCIRNCPWCIVPKKEGHIRPVADIEQIAGSRKKVVLMDNNVLASPADFMFRQLKKIADMQIAIDFNQGLDARLMTLKIARLFAKIHWIRFIRFAADSPGSVKYVRKAVNLLRKAGCRKRIFCYMLVKDDLKEAENRLRELVRMDVLPFAQPYRDFTTNAEPPKIQRDFARYANVKGGKICLTTPFSEYYH